MKKNWIIGMSAMVLLTMATGCAKEAPEPTQQEIQLSQNMKDLPKLPKETLKLIDESRGELEVDENGEIPEEATIVGSYSPGKEMVTALSSMSKEQLMEQEKLVQINIFINGIIRDEFQVAANTLYGKEKVAQYKKEFKDMLLSKEKNAEFEDAPENRIIDRIGLQSAMNDTDVAHHYVDDIIQQMNRTYIQTGIENDFKEKVTITGSTYGVNLMSDLQLMVDSSTEFVKLIGNYEAEYTDKDIATLNKYYNELFLDNLLKSTIDIENANSGVLGGFVKDEEGLWIPSDMSRLTGNILNLVYIY